MPAEDARPTLLDRLPAVRGRLEAGVTLGRFTWFKVGGPAEILFRPADEEDLADFLRECPIDIPVTIFGNASNMLVRDGGIDGVVIRMGSAFSTIDHNGSLIHAGAGAADLNVARRARDAGLGGLEFLFGIPGTIGGAVFMNAGAYGREIADVFVSCRAIDRAGNRHELDAGDLAFSYRHSALLEGTIITAATLRGTAAATDEILRRMEDIQAARDSTQPVRTPTGGSTFKNPPGGKAWELIDAAGCRGLRHGGAVVSEQHCNFLINDAAASAADLETLGEEVRRRVKAHAGHTLEWEIRRVGRPAAGAAKEVDE